MKRKRCGALIGLFCLFLWLSAGLTGCALFKEDRIGDPQQLASEGMQQFEDKDYSQAIKTFTALKERYPYSRYAILAELKLADAYFYREEYPDAISAYESFARLHPKNEAMPYVLYQTGESYYRQILTIDRDQTPTHQAILAFERLLESYPNSNHIAETKAKIRTCRQRLAEHELYVGRFYYKSKYYRAALGRLEGVLSDYRDILEPDTRTRVESLVFACKEKLASRPESEDRRGGPPSAPQSRSGFGGDAP
jgi:outer membrane protein assembly factor BamD